jgi:hypothetical protein
MIRIVPALITVILLTACSKTYFPLESHFDSGKVPPAPDYSSLKNWAAHPQIKDAADSVPLKSGLKDNQQAARADVFFIYPTIFTGKPVNQYEWNADAADEVLNKQIQTSTILNQASLFNGSCRVYAPYYRQAHYTVFMTSNRSDAAAALDLAYEDVRRAFIYYLENFNQGRPIVIASHSQGSLHGERLLKEFFDGKALKEKLVMAYLVGRAIKKNEFKDIKPTENPEQTGVWASWCTFIQGYYPNNYEQYYRGALATNPLKWSSEPGFVSKEKNLGGVGFRFTMVPQLADAESQDGLLWINKPYAPGRMFIRSKNWHRADINLFYQNIRENVSLRIDKYFAERTAAAN